MADLVLTDLSLKLNGTDLSDHVESATLEYVAAQLDTSSMGNGGIVTRLGGLKDTTLTVVFYQDWAAAKVEATLFSQVGSVITAEIIPVRGTAVGATNPRYSWSVLVEKFPIVASKVGEVVKITVALPGAAALVRAIV